MPVTHSDRRVWSACTGSSVAALGERHSSCIFLPDCFKGINMWTAGFYHIPETGDEFKDFFSITCWLNQLWLSGLQQSIMYFRKI